MTDPVPNRPTVPQVALKEGYWVRIGDESYPVHKVRSVFVKKALLKPFFGEVGHDSDTDVWGAIAIGFGSFFLGSISCFVLGIFGIIVGAGLAALVLFMIFREDLKDRQQQQLNPLIDVFISLEKETGFIQVATRIPEAEGLRMRQQIEEIVANAAKAEARHEHSLGENSVASVS